MFDTLSGKYLAIEYEQSEDQWYFIGQDSKTGRWIATNPVPSTYQLGRRVRAQNIVSGIDVDDTEAKGHTQSSLTKTGISQSSAMSTTLTTAAAALTLAGTQPPGGKVHQFFAKGGKGSQPGGNPPAGGGPPPAGPPGGGGGPPGGSGGGGPGAGGAGGAGAGGGNGKLGGNPPTEFNGDRSTADAFMNEFNLYRITNIDAEQMVNPMKRVALFLGFIKGPLVKDWVKRWTNWVIAQMNTGRPTMDEYFWTEVSRGFQAAFQDTEAREWAEEKL